VDVKDNSGAQVLGRTSWRRLGLVMVPTVVAAGALTVAMANGAIAASFAVSGQQFKLTASEIRGSGFVNYGTVLNADQPTAKAGPIPAAISAFKTATITNLCQSVVTHLPGIGDVTLTIKAGAGKDAVSATDLTIAMQQLNAGTATFSHINIGQDAGTLAGSADGAIGTPGMFGQQAESAVLDDVRQVANSTNAGSFELHDMSMGLTLGNNPCF
jgi:hypothetical protein